MQAICPVLAVFLAFIIPQIDGNVQWCNAFGGGQETLNNDVFVHFELLKIGRKSRVESGINAALTVARC